MATANTIITQAQYNFQGDASNTLVTSTMWEIWFNQAQQDLYRILRDTHDSHYWNILRRGSGIVAVLTGHTVTNGVASLSSVDLIVDVSRGTNDTHLFQVSPNVIRWIDENTYMQPWQEVYAAHYEGGELYIRPTTITAINVEYMIPPTDISNFSATYTTFPIDVHNILAMLMTTYAFASEEDLDNVNLWSEAVRSALNLPIVDVHWHATHDTHLHKHESRATE